MLGNKFYNYNGMGLGQGQLGQYTQGQLTGGEVSDPTSGNYQQMTSAPMLPNYLGIPFRILVSPFINFNPETRETDVLMFNSKNLGALIVQEDPHVRSWPARSVFNLSEANNTYTDLATAAIFDAANPIVVNN